MALNGEVLGQLIKAKMNEASSLTDQDAMLTALGEAIVEHITTEGVVSTTGTTSGGDSCSSSGGIS